ncbi:exosortase N [Flavobacterium tructae]|uniref:Exosortase N n=1 Tax=Flavobacterium tructae TaxID=1114873 RepID=A0A1S1J9K0_9FLAO|nr:exosortase N [Flavobacterium tructae]OHT47352.1 exosortase N [Flavobacterium tructae]OXB19633.1 exosortase N [Flavobacterium tructae]
MKDLILHKKPILAVFAILLLFAINSKILVLNLNNDFLGILGSLCLFIVGGRKTNFRINYFLVLSILLLEFISWRLNTKSVHFLSILLFLCLVFHYFTGKFSFIAFICLILFSTLFSAFFAHLTSEIKQSLCYIVYLTLKNFIPINKIEGVNFYINNAKITIDTACMGLSMFKTGLLFGAILMTLEERRLKQYYGVFQILSFCLLIIALNITSNYFRIVTLIFFNCTQENFLHHAIGLICFTVYQIIPMLFIIKYIKPKIGNNDSNKIKPKILTVLASFTILLATSIKIKNEAETNFHQEVSSEYHTKKGSWVNKEVFKIETPEKLTYIKTPSHNPMVCWTGSGYKIIESKKVLTNKEEIWFNKMEKDSQNYTSYWWYESNGKKYSSLIEVLLIKLIYGQPIFLINETSKSN